jgi:hypothetical protein
MSSRPRSGEVVANTRPRRASKAIDRSVAAYPVAAVAWLRQVASVHVVSITSPFSVQAIWSLPSGPTATDASVYASPVLATSVTTVSLHCVLPQEQWSRAGRAPWGPSGRE